MRILERCGRTVSLISRSKNILYKMDTGRKVMPGKVFTSYALLGGDIVICHKEVADEYKAAIDNLCINLSMGKSIGNSTSLPSGSLLNPRQ